MRTRDVLYVPLLYVPVDSLASGGQSRVRQAVDQLDELAKFISTKVPSQ